MVLIFSGCAVSPVYVKPGEMVLIEGVPFFRQEEFQCGPSALATVVNYWYAKNNTGESLSYADAVAAVYSPSAGGVLGIDLELHAKKSGFNAIQYQGSIADIKKNIDRAAPLIILVDYGFSLYQQNHFMVTTGYTGKGIVVNSGRKQNEIIPEDDLEKIWKKTNFWSLLIEPL